MIKSEHTGAKNGGGYWGTRKEAKAVSNQQRRHEDRAYRAVRISVLTVGGLESNMDSTNEHDHEGIPAMASKRNRVNLCRVVSPFCSPAYLPRHMAAAVLAADLELYEAMVAADAVPSGMQRPYTEG